MPGQAGTGRGTGKRSLFRRLLSSRRGQIVIPAVFVFPTMFIFIYLLFETAKLSREKIRHQFAVDSAAFIEMTNYSDYLNRTAYVNGSFPYRIFYEAFACVGSGAKDNEVQRTDNGSNVCLYNILYDMGAFPIYKGDTTIAPPSGSTMDASQQPWDMEFSKGRPSSGKGSIADLDTVSTSGVDLNVANPKFPSQFDLFQHDPMIYFILSWEAACGIYKLYAQVYMLLGSVQSAQRSVYQRLTEGHNFFRKSYYLNTGDSDPDTAGQDGVNTGFANADLTYSGDMQYINSIYFAARKFVGGIDPLRVVETETPIQFPSPGLFQLGLVNTGVLSKLGKGTDVYQGWQPDGGYFMKSTEYDSAYGCKQVSNNYPCVHAKIAVQCPNLNGTWSNSTSNNCIWPHPTPKYQTRLYP
jgi:hypothetical protein